MREFIIKNLFINISKLVIMKTFTKIGLAAALVCSAAMANAQTLTEPTYAPPVPDYPVEDVAPIFCDVYDPDGTKCVLSDPKWGAVSTFDYAGTADGSTGALVFLGMDQEQPADVTDTFYEWVAISLKPNVNTKTYTYLHVDVYCNEETDFRIGLHTYYVPSTASALEAYFPAIESESMTPGKWYSIDFPLTELKYTQEDNQPSLDWGGAAAALLRIGNGPDLFDYAGEIYATNIYLFNGEPKCLGGKVIEPESGIAAIENNYGFNTFVSNNMLNCRANETIKAINVYSVTGQVVKSVEVNNLTSNLSIADLTAGIYVVSAELANGQVASARIMK